jgi:hypothetical protein
MKSWGADKLFESLPITRACIIHTFSRRTDLRTGKIDEPISQTSADQRIANNWFSCLRFQNNPHINARTAEPGTPGDITQPDCHAS